MSGGLTNFTKMNGLGNEIIVADMRTAMGEITTDAAVEMASHPETSFDQIMAVHRPRSDGFDGFIRILNSDGSDAGACGNGMRCVVSWLHRETGKAEFRFETVSGEIRAQYENDDHISVDMGMPRFEWDQIPLAEEFADTRSIELQIGPIDQPILHTPSVANIGNPHAVFWVEDDINTYELDRFGPMLENHPIFPERANITIARVLSDKRIAIRTWERGAGLTRACGSAACATAVCAARTGRTGRTVTIELPGGELLIEWKEDNSILMTGPVAYEFTGRFEPATGTWEKGAHP